MRPVKQHDAKRRERRQPNSKATSKTAIDLTVAHRPAGVSLHPLASPVYRTDFVVSRASSAVDAGLATLRRLIAECADGWCRLLSERGRRFTSVKLRVGEATRR